MNARVIPIHRPPAGGDRSHPCLADQLRRIERSSQWLANEKLAVMSFGGTSLGMPVVVIAPHPRVYSLFSGCYERKGFNQQGALRHETWEAFDGVNHVRVRWEEVVACGV